jgi:hypothetical protein
MSDVTGSVSYSDVPGFPEGSVVDHVLVTLTGTDPANTQSQTVAPGTTSVTFASVAPDTYTVSAQAFPATGAGYGVAAVSNSVVVSAPVTVTLSIPSFINAS